MPEPVHVLDGASAPLETSCTSAVSLTGDTLSSNKKRKRKHLDTTRRSENANSQHISPRSLEGNRDQRRQSNGVDALQPAVLARSKAKGRSADYTRPFPDMQRLKDQAKRLETSRKSLPISSHIAEIRKALREQDVMILVGETGSGKSTQVPQMLVNEPWCKPRSVTVTRYALDGGRSSGSATASRDLSPQTVRVGGCIAITEPRRVAAVTLARRVAEEVGTPLGSFSSKSTVGYSVRFDQSTSPNTRIKFVTEGTLLQEMLRDPWLRAYSAVIVDEVHERGVNVDLLLGLLRNMVSGRNEGRGGISLKVCLTTDSFPSVTDQKDIFLLLCHKEAITVSCCQKGFLSPRSWFEVS